LSYDPGLTLDTALGRLADDPATALDPAHVALLLAADEYPGHDPAADLATLDGWAALLRPRLGGELERDVRALAGLLFDELGFAGNTADYYDPRNSYLNEVIARRTGLPITLSLVAMAVGTRAGMRVQGVGLPGHFIARGVDGPLAVYFDPFHGGAVLSVAACQSLVRQVTGVEWRATPDGLSGVATGPLIERMLGNLKGAYQRRADPARLARVCGRLVRLCPADVTQRRDLGIALLAAGQAGKAIDHLTAYVSSEPPPADRLEITEVLNEARADVARWN
jgi:regulator of sirC expression with transglutaminase-like and TPR domain